MVRTKVGLWQTTREERNSRRVKLKAAMSGVMFSRNSVVGDSNIKQEF